MSVAHGGGGIGGDEALAHGGVHDAAQKALHGGCRRGYAATDVGQLGRGVVAHLAERADHGLDGLERLAQVGDVAEAAGELGAGMVFVVGEEAAERPGGVQEGGEIGEALGADVAAHGLEHGDALGRAGHGLQRQRPSGHDALHLVDAAQHRHQARVVGHHLHGMAMETTHVAQAPCLKHGAKRRKAYLCLEILRVNQADYKLKFNN